MTSPHPVPAHALAVHPTRVPSLCPPDPRPGGARASRRLALAALATAGAAGLSGCASPQVQDYAREGPALDLRQYFNGRLIAHGLVLDRSGRLLQRFTVDMNCRWQGDTGTLDERFSYADGRREQRIWTLTRLPDGRYLGRASDVVGQAEGAVAGPALNWRYTLRLPVDGRTWDLQFDDWMYLIDEQVMLNRAQMHKFGLMVGEVLLSFRKLPA